MSYIGNTPFSTAFITDYFTGDGTTTAFTLSVAPAGSSSVIAQLGAALQSPADYSVIGSTITFSGAPPSGVPIIVRALGIPASGVVTTAYRTVTEITAAAGQTAFTPASYTPGFINVYQNGVMLGTADYTATNGTTVTLAVGATAGDLITCESFYISSVANAIQATPGSVNATYLAAGAAYQAFLDSASGTGTGALKLPVGTTAQRPTGAAGLIRQNSTTGNPEWWDATTSTWLQFSQPAGYTVNYLVVAGGGAAGDTIGGGGGGGGVLAASTTLSSGTSYTITIGAGGAGNNAGVSGGNGSNSSALSVTAIGGGGGGAGSLASKPGISGGSGGGSSPAAVGGSGTSGQGYAGGSSSGDNNTSGGGGGAGAVGGTNTANSISGSGGIGYLSSISGTATYYAGGGGGGARNGYSAGSGGLGGGVNGTSVSTTPTASPANTGGGGGGSGYSGTFVNGGAGGSGIVIISYLGSQRGTGGTVTSSGGYTIHTFTSSGTYTA